MTQGLTKIESNRMNWSMRFRIHITICAIGVATVFSGCSTMKLPDYPTRPPAEYAASHTQNNFCIGIQTITDRKEMEKYFGTDLTEINIVPIHVTAKNNHPTSTFLLSLNNISLHQVASSDKHLPKDKTDGIVDISEAKATFQGSGAATLVFLPMGIAMAFQGGKQISDAQIIELNMAAKKLYTKTLSSGESCDGFVYFKLPEKVLLSDDLRLKISIKELFNDASYTYAFPLK